MVHSYLDAGVCVLGNARMVCSYKLLWNGVLDLCPLKWVHFMWSRTWNPETFLPHKCGREWNSKRQSWALHLGGRKHGFNFHQPEDGVKPGCQLSWEHMLSYWIDVAIFSFIFCIVWSRKCLTDCHFYRSKQKVNQKRELISFLQTQDSCRAVCFQMFHECLTEYNWFQPCSLAPDPVVLLFFWSFTQEV